MFWKESVGKVSIQTMQLELVPAIVTGVFLLPLDGMLFHRGVTPSIIFAGALGGERRYGDKMPCPRDRTQCFRPGFEPRQADPESNTIARRPCEYMYFGPGSRSSELHFCRSTTKKKTWNDTITLVQ